MFVYFFISLSIFISLVLVLDFFGLIHQLRVKANKMSLKHDEKVKISNFKASFDLLNFDIFEGGTLVCESSEDVTSQVFNPCLTKEGETKLFEKLDTDEAKIEVPVIRLSDYMIEDRDLESESNEAENKNIESLNTDIVYDNVVTKLNPPRMAG